MRYDVKESIYKDENLLRYLRENSGWYKRLNRNESLENMVNEVVDVAAVALQMLEYLLDDCNVRMPDGKEKKNGNK